MGIEKLAEEAAGAFAADKAINKLDPNAGFLEKGAAMIAGFEGGGMLGDFIKDRLPGGEAPQAEAADTPADQSDDSQANDQA